MVLGVSIFKHFRVVLFIGIQDVLFFFFHIFYFVPMSIFLKVIPKFES